MERVREAFSSVEDVAVVERHRLLCSQDGRDWLETRIKEESLTHLVVAACSPRDHLQTFMDACARAGVNPFLLELANIREQCAWTTEDRDKATDKAIRMIRMSVARVRSHLPLEKKEFDANTDVLVVGGGVAGLTVSIALAGPRRQVFLVEKENRLGGMIGRFERAFPDMRNVGGYLEMLVSKVNSNSRIVVLTESEVDRILGYLGNFEITVRAGGANSRPREFRVGAIVLATGATPNLRVGTLPVQPGMEDVLTALEFEDLNQGGSIVCRNGSPPSSVAILHCVGREEKGYCSGVCCMYSLKFSRYLTEKLPTVRVTHLYRDMCLPGRIYQEFCDNTVGDRVEIIRHLRSKVTARNGRPVVLYESEDGSTNELLADMVILASGLQNSEGSLRAARVAGIPLGGEGFFAERHSKLAPESSGKDGIYIAGCAQGPKSIGESVIQAEAVAGKIMATLVPGRKIEPEVKVSRVAEPYCQGCGNCVAVCGYGAITLDERRKIAVVNELICRGCGNCAASCPSGAVSMKHFGRNQIYQEIVEAVR